MEEINLALQLVLKSKGDYRATHIYFYGKSNKNFPWELQIWKPEDYENNYDSHEKHKQEYKKSAKIHKDEFICVKWLITLWQ